MVVVVGGGGGVALESVLMEVRWFCVRVSVQRCTGKVVNQTRSLKKRQKEAFVVDGGDSHCLSSLNFLLFTSAFNGKNLEN